MFRCNPLFFHFPSKLAETATKRNPLGASEAGSSSETYRLELLFQLPLDQVQPPVDFICSGSGVDVDTGRAFDRLCALRGGVVHILTFYLTEREGDGADDTPGELPVLHPPSARIRWILLHRQVSVLKMEAEEARSTIRAAYCTPLPFHLFTVTRRGINASGAG